VRWGILSTGHIAQTFAKAVQECEGESLASVGSRSLGPAQDFARTFNIPSVHASYEALLADPTVEAVYIATPHPFHADWVVKAAQAGKHILCEKPMGMDLGEVQRMTAAAKEHEVLLMEAFMYRCHPQTHRLIELLKEGAIGRLRVIRASFSFDRDLGLQHRLFNKALGGGGILDLGCYPVSMARLMAGTAVGKPFAEPEKVLGLASLGPESGVDEWASAVLRFSGGILAELSCGIRVERESWSIMLYGTEGRLEVPSPWHCGFGPGETTLLRFSKGKQEPEVVTVRSEHSVYAYEVKTFSASVKAGKVMSPAMTPEDSLGNISVLDQWLKGATSY